MEPGFYIGSALLILILIIITTLIKKYSGGTGTSDAGQVEAEQPRLVANRAVGGARRRGPRQRMVATRAQDDDWQESEDEEMVDSTGKKIGAKKLRKLQEKAERKAQREAEEEDRKDKQLRAALLEEERKKEEAKQKAEEELQEEQRRLQREEQERKEHDEYLKLKQAFTVDEEGVEENLDAQQMDSLLQDFINYIKNMKVIMLEDLATHFKIKTQDAIDRVQTLLAESRLTGVMDDRGKFIYITPDEYEAVARFIKHRGRVSITELAESSNCLINLNPDNKDTHMRLVGEVA